MHNQYSFGAVCIILAIIISKVSSLSHKLGSENSAGKVITVLKCLHNENYAITQFLFIHFVEGIVLREQILFSRNSMIVRNFTIGYRYVSGSTVGVFDQVQIDTNGAQVSVHQTFRILFALIYLLLYV